MAEPSGRARLAAERRQQILDAARSVAEAEGWAAVTSRRLADVIGYTQPVLYAHFPGGKAEISLIGWRLGQSPVCACTGRAAQASRASAAKIRRDWFTDTSMM